MFFEGRFTGPGSAFRTNSIVPQKPAPATWSRMPNAGAGRPASTCISRANGESARKAAWHRLAAETRGPDTARDNSPPDGESSVREREERWRPNRASEKVDLRKHNPHRN